MTEGAKRRQPTAYQKNFRDSLGNIAADGRRFKIYPKKPAGRYHRARVLVSWGLLAFLFAAPFVRIGGHPLLLFNIIERKFVLFGRPFWPQDLYLFLLTVLTAVVALVLFTAIFGRLWCGWACPQTIFLEMVFRKIEYWIEGDAAQQQRLDRAPWSGAKVVRKVSKHLIFFGLSFLIANVFLAYVIGSERLWEIVTDPPSQHLQGLLTIIVFSLVFYGIFARFREQVCIIVCPYGRFQSVMVNEETIAVTYDHGRGEPRGKLRREPNAGDGEHGDCVDCEMCVRVCPTGIDIRNGIQLECVNCTACVDACDQIMDSVERPRGLIRYASYRSIADGAGAVARGFINTRTMTYATLFCVLFGAVTYLFANRADLEAVILREPGQLFNELPHDRVSNFYRVKVINKTFEEVPVEIRLEEPADGELTILGSFETVAPQSILEARFFAVLSADGLQPGKNPILISVFADGERVSSTHSSFIAPHRENPPKRERETR